MFNSIFNFELQCCIQQFSMTNYIWAFIYGSSHPKNMVAMYWEPLNSLSFYAWVLPHVLDIVCSSRLSIHFKRPQGTFAVLLWRDRWTGYRDGLGGVPFISLWRCFCLLYSFYVLCTCVAYMYLCFSLDKKKRFNKKVWTMLEGVR